MRTLKKTIISGVYKKIPNCYSSELDTLIKMCLRVDPKDRPSAECLLQNETFERFFGSCKIDEEIKVEGRLLEKISAPKKR